MIDLAPGSSLVSVRGGHVRKLEVVDGLVVLHIDGCVVTFDRVASDRVHNAFADALRHAGNDRTSRNWRLCPGRNGSCLIRTSHGGLCHACAACARALAGDPAARR